MKLFHISSNDLNNKIITPKIPDNILTKMGIENNSIPRISFAPEIKYSLLAIGYNRLKSGPDILNVYEPDNYRSLKIIDSKELDQKGYVPDAKRTREVWVLNNVKFKYLGKIKIIKPKKEFVKIDLPGGQSIKNYFWEYKVIDGEFE